MPLRTNLALQMNERKFLFELVKNGIRETNVTELSAIKINSNYQESSNQVGYAFHVST